MKKQSGRKADILLTDGVDMGSKVSISTAIEAAQRADTLLYSIRYYDDQAYSAPMGRGGYGRYGGRRGRPMPRPAAMCPTEKGAGAPLQRDRRRLFRSLQEALHRGHLSSDRGRAAQPIQHWLHVGQTRRQRRVSQNRAAVSQRDSSCKLATAITPAETKPRPPLLPLRPPAPYPTGRKQQPSEPVNALSAHDRFEHANVFQGGRVDTQRVLLQYHEVRRFARLNRAPGMLVKCLPRRCRSNGP